MFSTLGFVVSIACVAGWSLYDGSEGESLAVNVTSRAPQLIGPEDASAPQSVARASVTADGEAPETPAPAANEPAVPPGFPADGELLPKVLWNFDKNAGTVERVLAHPLFNPQGKNLSGPAQSELRSRIRQIKQTLGPLERSIDEHRVGLAVERANAGAYEAVRTDEKGRVRKPTETNREVEIGVVGVGDNRYVYRINWGEDPEYDRKRLAVFQAKQDAVDSLKAFIDSHE